MSLAQTIHSQRKSIDSARLHSASGATTTQNLWTSTTEALPEDGHVVQFVLDYRDIAMTGIYSRREFSSRWSRYAPASISEWRYAPEHATFPAAPALLDCA
jgi:hypothetical protein